MEHFDIEQFNRTSSITVNDKVRIKNLVANARLASENLKSPDGYALTFSTTRKGKPAISMTYVIKSEHLTEEQNAKLNSLFVPQV